MNPEKPDTTVEELIRRINNYHYEHKEEINESKPGDGCNYILKQLYTLYHTDLHTIPVENLSLLLKQAISEVITCKGNIEDMKQDIDFWKDECFYWINRTYDEH